MDEFLEPLGVHGNVYSCGQNPGSEVSTEILGKLLDLSGLQFLMCRVRLMIPSLEICGVN